MFNLSELRSASAAAFCAAQGGDRGDNRKIRLELFPFRFRDPLTGKWVRARYVAERHVIAERYAEFEIIGPPEIRDVDPDARYFNPAGGRELIDRLAVRNVSAIIAVARSTVGESRRVVIAAIAVWAEA